MLLTREQIRMMMDDQRDRIIRDVEGRWGQPRTRFQSNAEVPLTNASSFSANSFGGTMMDPNDGRVLIVDDVMDESKAMRPESPEPEPNLREVWAD